MPHNPLPLPELDAAIVASFGSRMVPQPSGCWHWGGRRTDKGYGCLTIRGRIVRAHRLSYAIAKSDPGERLVCHSCDNPICVNPAHLWLGTDADNAADRARKGRSWMGPRAKRPAGHCIRCGHERTDDYVEFPAGREPIRRCRNCVRLRDRAKIASARVERSVALADHLSSDGDRPVRTTTLNLTPTQRRDLATLTPRAQDAELRRLIAAHEYAAWAKRLETEFNCFVPSGAAEARFSRSLEARMPALLEAVRGQLSREAA